MNWTCKTRKENAIESARLVLEEGIRLVHSRQLFLVQTLVRHRVHHQRLSIPTQQQSSKKKVLQQTGKEQKPRVQKPTAVKDVAFVFQ